MTRIAIIPARSGSKRIPHKNVKDFCGKPIIAYSIETAIKSKLFDEVMVSTDDKKIADIAKQYGANVPFFRSAEKSDDYSTLSDVIKEVLLEYKSIEKEYDEFVCILPTAPFLTIEKLKEGINVMESKGFSSVFPVLRFSYPIQRALKLSKEKSNISMIWPENMNVRSQDLEPSFHDSGQFYIVKTLDFLEQNALFMNNSGIIELSEMEVQDIDTPEDWKMAEFKFQFLKSNGK